MKIIHFRPLEIVSIAGAIAINVMIILTGIPAVFLIFSVPALIFTLKPLNDRWRQWRLFRNCNPGSN